MTYQPTTLEQELEKILEEFDELFPCIQLDCRGDGCQFHAKYLFPIRYLLCYKITQAHAEGKREERERIMDDFKKLRETHNQPELAFSNEIVKKIVLNLK